jgi:ribosomal protein L40E
MKQFTTLLGAAEFAVTLATGWHFATADERYEKTTLLALAETSDSENPIDGDSFYVVSPSGAIGFCEDGEDIDWLFLSDAAPNEDLPLIYQTAAQVKICTKCGSGVVSGARFCGKCGERLN